MPGYLLDVNVLVALAWPRQVGHQRAVSWFHNNHRSGWATCPITQAGFVRILSNPVFSQDALSPSHAQDLLDESLKHPSHRFWPADSEYSQAVLPFREAIVGHRQVMDAYLVGLALRRKARFVTFDRRVRALFQDESQAGDIIVELSA